MVLINSLRFKGKKCVNLVFTEYYVTLHVLLTYQNCTPVLPTWHASPRAGETELGHSTFKSILNNLLEVAQENWGCVRMRLEAFNLKKMSVWAESAAITKHTFLSSLCHIDTWYREVKVLSLLSSIYTHACVPICPCTYPPSSPHSM